MDKFTNHTPGARGINVKVGEAVSTRWVEPGQTLQLVEGESVHGPLPDLGKPADHAEKSAGRVTELEAALATAEERVTELEAAKANPAPWMIAAAVGQLDGKNDEHWTKGGEPRVDAVAALLDADIGRDDIKAAAPDASRSTE